MLWAGGADWEAYIDSLAVGAEEGVRIALKKSKKMYPKDWEWKGEHWHIARWVGQLWYQSLPGG